MCLPYFPGIGIFIINFPFIFDFVRPSTFLVGHIPPVVALLFYTIDIKKDS